ncbi:alpha/beta fold hydrolase [Phormidesmis sp. 146-12]
MNWLKRWGWLGLAIALILSSWWGIVEARSGLVVRSLERDGVPLIYMAPKQATQAPGVLIAHGFAGSKQLMLSYGHVLAHAGYATMLWDFDGHGANPAPLTRFDLSQNLKTALNVLIEQPEVNRDRLALLGHSMGSAVVIQAGVEDVNRFAATIAISPAAQNVSPNAPKNLQLQIGAWEGRLAPYTQKLLTAAGGENAQFTAGKARELITIPNVEHITILFNAVSHQAALRWLDATFGQQIESSYVDRRMIWYALHLTGWLIVLGLLASKFASETVNLKLSPWQTWGGLATSSGVASLGLKLLDPVVSLESLGGVQVGGAVGVWFLIAGLVWLAILFRWPRLSGRSLGLGFALFGLLWVAFGAMAQVVWLQWWLIPTRLAVWLPIALACFPWFLASGMAQSQRSAIGRVGWWLTESLVLVAGFTLAIVFLPKLGFIFLLLPLFPVFFGLFSFVIGRLNDVWIYAIGTALFFAWLLAAGFPLSA